MNIVEATQSYECWLQRHVQVVPADLERKHRQLAENPYSFFRGSHYRWAQRWQCGADDVRRAPRVLAVADLHIENFGTWRDLEGRLIWGVNDFDEACPLPYTQDLVRLAAGVAIARKATDLDLGLGDATEAILAGYRSSLKQGPKAFVIENQHSWLREISLEELREPRAFWEALEKHGESCEDPPPEAERLLRRELPEERTPETVFRRVAGMGSLGMPRFVALAEWAGSPVAREAKQLPPPAYYWARGSRARRPRRYSTRLADLHPHPDPCYRPDGHWVVKRLAPDCAKVKLTHLDDDAARLRLLEAMGFETANLHLGSAESAETLLHDLDARERGWLKAAAKEMASALLEDYDEWRSLAN